MMLRPTPSEERWLTLSRRLRRNPRDLPFSEHTGGWRTARLPSRCTFFVLGLVAAGMIGIITEQLGPTGALVTAGLVSIAVAEWLILSRRHFWSGIEEALGIAGLTMLAFHCRIAAAQSAIYNVGGSHLRTGARCASTRVGLGVLWHRHRGAKCRRLSLSTPLARPDARLARRGHAGRRISLVGLPRQSIGGHGLPSRSTLRVDCSALPSCLRMRRARSWPFASRTRSDCRVDAMCSVHGLRAAKTYRLSA
jgi:hypothetical protein